MTNDPEIPLVKLDLLNSTYDLYSSDPESKELPEVASVVPFFPELDYFLKYQSSEFKFQGTNTMSKNQYTMLFEEDNTSLRTLLSPINLHAFYEWYKQGDFVSIKKRFSYDPKK